jgi:hypothetical protein
MKLAEFNDITRDGQLAVVARDLKTPHIVDGIAPTLQVALDDWSFITPQLTALYADLNAGRAPTNWSLARPIAIVPKTSREWPRPAATPCSVRRTKSCWFTRNGASISVPEWRW